MTENMEALVEKIVELKEDAALNLAEDLFEGGTSPVKVMESCRSAMEIVGERFEKGEYFLPELMMAGEILSGISERAKPYLQERVEEEEDKAAVILGTVEGDIHDIGKDIVSFMLDVNGFDVIDLGVDVPAEEFVSAVKENDASIVGMSCLLTVAYDPMKETVAAFEEAGIRDEINIMIGGAATDEKIREYTGADAWGKDATEAVRIAQEWAGGE